MTSFRLKFIDVDASFESVVADSTIKGYMVIRAPKGEATPVYFDPGNSAVIEALCGLGTAHWSDINEAIAFNAEYGIWISAPAGTSSDYPSYYGGVYITKNGTFPFYQVSDRNNVNWLTPITCGSESSYDEATNGVVEISTLSDTKGDTKKQGKFSISGISNTFFSNLNKIVLDFWGSDFNQVAAKKFELGISKGKIYAFKANGTLGDKEIGTATQGTDGKWVLNFGTNDSISATDTDCPYFTFDKLVDYSSLYVLDTATNSYVLNADYQTALKSLISDGGTKTIGTKSYQSVKGLASRIHWIVSVKNTTYAYAVQKSCTEKVTNFTINDIGYDKYKYDLALQFAYNFDGMQSVTVSHPDNIIAVISDENGNKNYPSGIYHKSVNDDGSISYTNVTSDYLTKYVRLISPLTGSTTSDSAKAYSNTLYYVGTDSSGNDSLIVSDFSAVNQPKVNLGFNTIDISVTEEIYPGKMTSGGNFVGSLDEDGKDTYGSNIYWPEVLPDDAMSFIEIVPVKKFDDDLNENGFFTGTRIVDLYGPEEDTYTAYLQGQRYISKLVQDNIDAGLVGNVWNASMHNVLKEGWTEAFMPKYDEAYVFMEPTGDEDLKATLLSLRAKQRFSTMISEKKITNSEFLNPSKIVVNARGTGTAQYVGEFMQKDPYTNKKYYFCPIGDVGLQIARIINAKLGGWPPAGTNITGNLGGQLSRSVLSAKYDFTDDQLKALDEKGLNPIAYNTKEGLIITSQKTTQDPNNYSDWSSLGHTLAFDLCKREIRDQVMYPQILKPIDDYWMDLRERATKDILDKRTTGKQPIWAAAKCRIKDVNTNATKAKRNFMIEVTVKVNVFSETITLLFSNVAQTTEIS